MRQSIRILAIATVVLGTLAAGAIASTAASFDPPVASSLSAGFAPAGSLVYDPTAPEVPAITIPPISDTSPTPVFGGETFVSMSTRQGEPGLRITPDGTIYVHVPGAGWISQDSGASFQQLPVRGTTGVVTCGCDSDMSVDNNNIPIYVDLAYPTCVNVGTSLDKGQTWITNKFACYPDSGMDRQWIDSSGGAHTYLTYRIGGAIKLLVAEVSPVPVFVNFGTVNAFGSNFRAGSLAVDHASDTAYLSYTSGNSIRNVVVSNGVYQSGHDYLIANTAGSNLDSFSANAVDDAGNVYTVWTEQVGGVTLTYMASSTDHGVTWSAKHLVQSAPKTTTFPWVVAGGDGKVGVVYYGAQDLKLPGAVAGDWFVYYAYSANGHAATPTFTEGLAIPHKVKTGPICTGGTGCGGGTRNFLDFFEVQKFPDGRAAIIFNDIAGLSAGSAPYVKFVQQTDGPRLV